MKLRSHKELADEFDDAIMETVKKASKYIPKELPRLVAKKAFKIEQNEFVLEIKIGDDLTNVPERYLANLKTEGVI